MKVIIRDICSTLYADVPFLSCIFFVAQRNQNHWKFHNFFASCENFVWLGSAHHLINSRHSQLSVHNISSLNYCLSSQKFLFPSNQSTLLLIFVYSPLILHSLRISGILQIILLYCLLCDKILRQSHGT